MRQVAAARRSTAAATSKRSQPRRIPARGTSVAEALTATDRHDRREHERCAASPRSRSDPGVVAAYVHNAAAPDLGKIGVLVALEVDRRHRPS